MVNKLDTTELISVWCLITFLSTSVHCVSKTYSYGPIASTFDDYVCSTNNSILIVNVESDLYCSYLCVSDVTCDTFFYHHDDKICVTCDDVYLDTSSLVPYTGMSYYIPEQIMTSIRGWNNWSIWSLCSATCNQGTRSRTRSCGGSIDTCTGDSVQTETCNTYNCTPLARTCADWASRGLSETREMLIDPDGNATTFSDVSVFCDLDSRPRRALTVLHHNREQQTRVDGYEPCGSYEVVLTYTVGFEAAKKIADISSRCYQYVKWDCYKADLSWPRFTPPCTAWKNRSMVKSGYFTGPYQSGKYCQCGHQGTCLDPAQECNCDKQAPFLTRDEGLVTLKSDLPIYAFTAGDTGGADEYGMHTVGPLKCW